jgi:hypothetical protein
MTFEKWQALWYRCYVYEGILGILPSDFPNHRQLHIQNEKLKRLLDGVFDKDGHWKMLAGHAETLSKEQGQRGARANAQARKMHSMFADSMKIWFRTKRKFTNQQFGQWQKDWDKAIYGAALQIRNRLTQGLISKAPGALFGKS